MYTGAQCHSQWPREQIGIVMNGGECIQTILDGEARTCRSNFRIQLLELCDDIYKHINIHISIINLVRIPNLQFERG